MLNDLSASATADQTQGLGWLVSQLDAHSSAIDEVTARRLLTQADLTAGEVAPYVKPQSESYGRRAVVRREHYELLVLTWMPGQQSVAHDHSGSLCGLKVVQGSLMEQLYVSGADGQVRPTTGSRLAAGDITVDPGVVIHSLGNPADSGQTLVTVHLYSPPLPEVRRYAVAATPPASVFLHAPPPETPTVVILGGGFTGTMTLANLLREAQNSTSPLRLVLIDRQPAWGEGIAYRTNDPRHLLNVSAGKMSAWPDRPDDFLEFARALDPAVQPGDFLPRRLYGQYVRQTLLQLAPAAAGRVSIEIIRDDAVKLAASQPGPGWQVETAGGGCIRARLAIITLGHRPPAEQFIRRWRGPRLRFVADPWAALVLTQIRPDEPVLVLGSGLTAVDAILTLGQDNRTAPLIVVSRHGLLPQPHLREPKPPAEVSALLAQWLDPAQPLSVRRLVRALRERIGLASEQGIDWRQVVDALRPATAKIWARLSVAERGRFLRHVRPFWEVHRHRTAPVAADKLEQLRARKVLEVIAGALMIAEADGEGIDVTLSIRGQSSPRHLRVAWVINCTGPGIHHRRSTHPILSPLLESGVLGDDVFGLGLQTDVAGRAVDAQGKVHADLLIAGTLRKSTLWESTAVPELRQQAAAVARIALETLAADATKLS